MANTFKYNVSTETEALKKGNFWIGANDVPKPTDTTGFWHGITPPLSGYTIYLNKASGGPAIYVTQDDNELISLTNRIGNLALTSATQSLNYYATQSDKMILNRDYEPIVTSGLTLCLDAGFTPSYQGSGTTWYDLSPQVNNGTLVSGSQYKDGPLPYFQYSGNNQNVETTVTTVELNTGLTQGNTVEQLIWGDGSQGNGNMPFSFYNIPWDIWWLGNTFAFNNGSSLLYGFTGANDLLLNKWCHVVAYFPNNWPSSSGSTKMFINGVERPLSFIAGTFQSRTISESQTVGIGGGYTDGSDTFNWNGRIALTRIYNRQLSSSEVLNNYQATFPRFLGKNIVMNGLVNYLDAGYNVSYPGTGTTWNNISGVSGGTGTLTNGPTYSTDGGGSIVFDGVDDIINITDNPSLDISNNISISLWFNPSTYKSSVYSVNFFKKFEGISNANFQFYFDGVYTPQKIRVLATRGGTWGSVSPDSAVIGINQWTNVVWTYSSTGGGLLYINGVSQGNSVGSGVLSTNNTNIQIGQSLNGKISSSSIYNKVLTPQEVLQNYQAQLPTILGENIITNGLVLYLDAGYRTSYPTSGTSWGNVSGVSGFTGTLTNGPTYNSGNGGSIVFDGTDDRVFGNQLPLNSPYSFTNGNFTLEHWIKPTAYQAGSYFGLTNMILSKGPASTFNYATQVTNSTTLSFISRDNAEGLKYLNFTVPSLTNSITHIVFAVSFSQVSLFINGILSEVKNLTGNPITPYNNDSINIGGEGNTNTFFTGNMYIHRIYNRMLSSLEIQQNFNAQKSRFGL
jgi:hypothetical protein